MIIRVCVGSSENNFLTGTKKCTMKKVKIFNVGCVFCLKSPANKIVYLAKTAVYVIQY